VRLGGEDAMLAAFFGGRGDGFEFCFDGGFTRGGGRREANDLILRLEGQTIYEYGCGDRD
jgi:hypothetical protein